MIKKELIGANIKRIRKSKKITQEKLAEMINVDFGYISKLEVGQNYPSFQTLNKIAEALGVDATEFFYNKNAETDYKSEIVKLINNLSLEKQAVLFDIAKSINRM